MVKSLKNLLFLLVIAQVFLLTGCPKQVSVNTDKDSKIPFSDKVVTGTLDNGFKYYIRENDYPSNKVELRLNVRSGSLNETDEERGLAHFVEHMAFNGTKNFKGNEVVKFMEKAGLTFGADTNAYTSSENTNYQLSVPFDDEQLIVDGFRILRDWATNITFDEKEIEKEKGVIVEEWRARNDPRSRIREQSIIHTMKESAYVERDPIGLMNIVKGANKELLEGYYKKWYTPENMSIVVVGVIDKKKAEKLIKDIFSDMEKRSTPTPVSKNLNYPSGIRVGIASDKDFKGINASIYMYSKGKITETYNEFKDEFIKNGALAMFNRRMNLNIQEKKLDLLSVMGRKLLFGDNANISMFAGSFNKGNFNKQLEILLTEMERAARYGFTKSEYDFFKKVQTTQINTVAKEGYKFPSKEYAEQISSYDTKGGYFTEFSQDKILVEKVFNESNITNYNNAFKELVKSRDIVLMISIPESYRKHIKLTNAEFKSLIKKVENAEIANVTESEFVGKLISEEIKPGTVIKKEENKELGTVEVTYSNNAKLIIKKNVEDKDKYVIAGKKLGGYSIMTDREYLLSSILPKVIASSGFEKISNRNLQVLMAGSIAHIAPETTEYTFGYTGGGVSKDLEKAFQLIYKYATAANIDEDVLNATKKSLELSTDLDNKDKKLQAIRKANIELYNNKYRRNYLLKEDLAGINAAELLGIHKKYYSDLSNFVFTISGDVDEKKAIELGAKYIGGFKKIDNKSNYIDRNLYLKKHRGEKTVAVDNENKTTFNIIYMKDNKRIDNGMFYVAFARNTLSIRLREAIREELGGVYSIRSVLRYAEYPTTDLNGKISFTAEPSRKEELKKRVFEIFNEFIEKGITAEDLEIAKKSLIRNYETRFKENKYWANVLPYNSLLNEKVYSLNEAIKIFNTVKVDEVNKFIKDTMTDVDMYTLIIDPEKK